MKILLLFVSVIYSMTHTNAQTSTVDVFLSAQFFEKTIDGFERPVSCLDISKGQFAILFKRATNIKTINIALYVPKKEFTESFSEVNSYNYFKGEFVYPTMEDLEKIKEYKIGADFKSDKLTHVYFTGYDAILWDGMTDPALTNGKSYIVQDNVVVIATDSETGKILNSYDPFQYYSRVSRYQGRFLHRYTAKEKSVVCDIYFTSQLPVTKAVPFMGDGCTWGWADWTKSKEGIEKVVQSLLAPTCIYNDIAIEAYQVFENLAPDKNGVYHISWEIKDVKGNFFDVARMKGNPNLLLLGLNVEGDGQVTYPLGLPEFGGMSHRSGDYIPAIGEFTFPPRPLNPDEPNFYPNFTITNDGELLQFICKNSNYNVFIPKTVKKIDANVFSGCNEIEMIIGQNGLNIIGDNAFAACENLRTATLPKSVTSIGTRAFAGCRLNKVMVEWRTPLSVPNDIFEGNPKELLYVPTGTKALYQAANVWKDFGAIVEYTPVSNEIIETVGVLSLKAFASNGILNISGLQSDKQIRIYDINGQLVYKGIAKSETEQIPLNTSGIYIVSVANQSIKVIVE